MTLGQMNQVCERRLSRISRILGVDLESPNKRRERLLVTLPTEAPDAAVMMHTDATKLRQILLNLLFDAAKFTSRGEIGLALVQRLGGLLGGHVDVARAW